MNIETRKRFICYLSRNISTAKYVLWFSFVSASNTSQNVKKRMERLFEIHMIAFMGHTSILECVILSDRITINGAWTCGYGYFVAWNDIVIVSFRLRLRFSLSLLMMLFVIANVKYTLGKRKVRSVGKIILYYVLGSMLV